MTDFIKSCQLPGFLPIRFACCSSNRSHSNCSLCVFSGAFDYIPVFDSWSTHRLFFFPVCFALVDFAFATFAVVFSRAFDYSTRICRLRRFLLVSADFAWCCLLSLAAPPCSAEPSTIARVFVDFHRFLPVSVESLGAACFR